VPEPSGRQFEEDGRVTAPAAPVRLRDAGVPDVRAVAEFQTRCWREAYRGLVPQSYLDRVTVADREIRWRERMVSGGRWVALAEAGGLLVGVVSWGTTDVPGAPALELKSLYVDRDHRGTGVAAALLQRAVREDPAHRWVFRDNSRARAFYAEHGFAADGHQAIDRDTGLAEQRLVRR
jgi:GNAT superfamily N-acetyltransferase